MFPFVVPERVTGAEPPPIMRFVLKSETPVPDPGAASKNCHFQCSTTPFLWGENFNSMRTK